MWTLHVEDFGRIENADIEVSPLTLFVGDNNSGKSYLLSLLYGLMCADDVLSDLCEDSTEYKACAEWLQKAFGELGDEEKTEKPFDDDAYAVFQNLFNRILQNNRQAIIQSIFNADVSAGKISVTFSPEREKPLSLNFNVSGARVKMRLPDGLTITASRFWETSNNAKLLLAAAIPRILKSFVALANRNISFLPTARTGLLVTYPALTKDAFSRAYGSYQKKNVDLSLTKPFTDFLGNLTTVNKKDISDARQPIVGFIERNIMQGKILVSNDLPLPEFYYLPENTETPLPMYLSSDVIKELAPLVLTLQYTDANALFVEEPEMSLHTKLQQMMARTLIKLVNAGTPVFAATHSDTILQHVNNMVKLNNLPEARKQTLIERFKFDPDDPISADKISMYQFDVQGDGKTAVRPLTHGDYGFEVPTFYDPLEKIMEQTQATEPDAEEYED